MNDPTPAQAPPVVEYDAFVSYRSASSARQARQLDRALFHLGKRHRTDRAPNVFLDTSDLVAGALDENLKRALGASRNLVVLLDSTTKESPWVAEEIEYWLANGGAVNRLFLVRTDPALDLSWDRVAKGFTRPDGLPAPLRVVFAAEQKYFDLPRSRSVDESSLVGLYSAVMDVEPEALLLEESQYQRSRRRRSTIVIGVLAALLVVAVGAGIIARQQSRRSEQSARTARGEAAASGALLTLPYSYPDAIDQALTASTMSSSQSVRSALIAVANGTGALRRTVDWSQTGTGRPAAGVAFSTDGSRLMAWGPAKDGNRSHLAAWSVVSGEKDVDADIAAAALRDVREIGAVGYVGCSAKGPVLIARRTYSVLTLIKPIPTSDGDELSGSCATYSFAGGVVIQVGGEGTSLAPGVVFVSYAGRHTYYPDTDLTRVNPLGWSVPLISGNRLTMVSARGQASVRVPDSFDVRFVTSDGAVLGRAGDNWYRIQHSGKGTSAEMVRLPVPSDTAAVSPYTDYRTKAGYAWITRSGEVGWSNSAETVELTDDTRVSFQRSTYEPAIIQTGSGFFASVGGTAYTVAVPDFGHGWITRTLSLVLPQPDADGTSPVTSYCDSGATVGLAGNQWLVSPFGGKPGIISAVSTEAGLKGCTLVDPGPPLVVDGIRITDGTASSAGVAVSDGSPGGVALFRPGGVIQLFASGGRVENVWRESKNPGQVSALGERMAVGQGDETLSVSLSGGGTPDVLANVHGTLHSISPDGLEVIMSSSQFEEEGDLRLIAGRGRQDTFDRRCDGQWPMYVPGPRFESDIGDAENQLPAVLTETGWIDCRSGTSIALDKTIAIEEYEIGAEHGRITWSRTRDAHTDYQVTTWNRDDDGSLTTRKLPMSGDRDARPERAAFDPTGEHLLVSDPDTPIVRSYTWSDGQWKAGRTLQAAIGDIQATAWSRDSSLALAVGEGGGFELYDMATGRRLITQVGTTRDPTKAAPEHIKVTESDGFLRAYVDGGDPVLLEIPIDLGRLRELLCVVHHAAACGPGPGS